MFLLKVSRGKLTILLFARILTELLGIAEKTALSLFLHQKINTHVPVNDFTLWIQPVPVLETDPWLTLSWSTGLCIKAKSQHHYFQHLLDRQFFALRTPCPHRVGGNGHRPLLRATGPLGSASHRSPLRVFSTLSLPMQTAKAPFPFGPTHTAIAIIDDH